MHSSSRWCIPSGAFLDEKDIASSRDGSKRASANSLEFAARSAQRTEPILEDERHARMAVTV